MVDYADLLSTPSGYATPEQIKSAQEYAATLQKQSLQPVTHWTQGIGHMVEALMGGMTAHDAEEKQKARNAAASRLLMGDESAIGGIGGGTGDTASRIASGAGSAAGGPATPSAGAPTTPTVGTPSTAGAGAPTLPGGSEAERMTTALAQSDPMAKMQKMLAGLVAIQAMTPEEASKRLIELKAQYMPKQGAPDEWGNVYETKIGQPPKLIVQGAGKQVEYEVVPGFKQFAIETMTPSPDGRTMIRTRVPIDPSTMKPIPVPPTREIVSPSGDVAPAAASGGDPTRPVPVQTQPLRPPGAGAPAATPGTPAPVPGAAGAVPSPAGGAPAVVTPAPAPGAPATTQRNPPPVTELTSDVTPHRPLPPQPGASKEEIIKWQDDVKDYEAAMEARKAGMKANAEERAKEANASLKVIRNRASDARDEISQLQLLSRLMQHPNYSSGMFNPANVALSQTAKLLGIGEGQAATLSQLATKLGQTASLAGIRSMADIGAVRIPEMQMISRSNYSDENTPEANRAVVELRLREAKRALEVHEMASEYAKKHNNSIDDGFFVQLNRYAREHPLISEDEMKAYDKVLPAVPNSPISAAAGPPGPLGAPPPAVPPDLSRVTPEQKSRLEAAVKAGTQTRESIDKRLGAGAYDALFPKTPEVPKAR